MRKAKLVSHNRTKSVVSTDNEMSKLILLIFIVALVFALFYVITLFVTKKGDKSNSNGNTQDNVQVSIQYEKILVSNMLTQKKSEYYVLAYLSDDKFLDLYKSYFNYYKNSVADALPYYFIDLSDVFNKSFVTDESNLNVSDIRDIKFSQTALLRIRDGKIISTYEGSEQITGKLGRMTK